MGSKDCLATGVQGFGVGMTAEGIGADEAAAIIGEIDRFESLPGFVIHYLDDDTGATRQLIVQGSNGEFLRIKA